MYALKPIEPNGLTVTGTHEDFPFDAKLYSDIQDLSPKINYSKTRLAQMWGVNRNTIRRWVVIAVNAGTPGFNRAFDQIEKLVDCPHCQTELRLSDIQYLHLKRNWMIECPKCGSGFKGQPRILETTHLEMKLPGKYARVLRIVGYLIANYGTETTKQILSDSPLETHKKIRQAIRQLLLSGI